MGTLRLTSPGILLILAVIAAGSIFLLDSLYLAPQMTQLQLDALREQAIQADELVRQSLRGQQERLRRAQRVAVDEGLFDEEPDSLRRLGAISGATHLWLTDADGQIRRLVRTDVADTPDAPDHKGLSDVAAAVLADAHGHTEGLIAVGKTVLVFIRADEQFWMAAPLEAVLPEPVALVRDRLPPTGALDPDNNTYSLWWVETDEILGVGWDAVDAAGNSLGYFQTELPVRHVHRQAVAARQMVLVVLGLAVALAALVILGAHILIAGPIYRLLQRLKDIQYGDTAPEGLTHNLHGEPLVLARRLQSAFDKLAEMSRTDDLTGLANRRHFGQVLDAFYTQARRYNRPLSLIVLDIDFFKTVNDTGGHQAGDELLRAFAKVLTDACRQADLPARLGGDEFAVLLPETTAQEAEAVGRRICDSVTKQDVLAANVEIQITVSAGLTDLNVTTVDSPDTMLAAADRALYEAKDRGRSCLVRAHELEGLEWVGQEGDRRVNRLQKTLVGLDSEFKSIFVRAMSEVVDVFETRGPHMADHARRTQGYGAALATEMGLPESAVGHIQIASMLHDVGMLVLPDAVLLRTEPLTADQVKILRQHPLISVRIMERMQFLEQEIPAVRYHHERYDGTGYPEGLAGAAIPLAARILSVVDAYDAMMSVRPWREPMSQDQALQELRNQAGKQFDRAVVETFVTLANRHGEAFARFAEARISDSILAL